MTSYAHGLGGHAFNHGPSGNAEAHYDSLREAARIEQGKHQHFAAEARKAYEKGDGAGAHEFSQQSKRHEAEADRLNQEASDFILKENNAPDRVPGDTIDLHGQYVEEAESILERRIRDAQGTGQSHLHVIVGKGNHSVDHVQKLKPRVERVCRELGLHYDTEHNEGRIYVNLRPGESDFTPNHNYSQTLGPDHPDHGRPMYETARPWPLPSDANAAAEYPGAQHHHQHQNMQYGHQQHLPQQQMQHVKPKRKESKCCGLCIVM